MVIATNLSATEFAAASLPYPIPHSLRRTMALHMDTLNLTLLQEKAFSLGFGHDDVRTTRQSYGPLPAHQRRAIMQGFWERKYEPAGGDFLQEMQALLNRQKASPTG